MTPKEKTTIVVFTKEIPAHYKKNLRDVAMGTQVLGYSDIKVEIEALGYTWIDIESYLESGNIREARTLAEELSLMQFQDGTRITKYAVYKGFELWWIYYNSIFHSFCLPYTQYKKLLKALVESDNIHLVEPPHENLFSLYLQAHGRTAKIYFSSVTRTFALLPVGILLQIILTCISIVPSLIQRKKILIFTGDKFASNKDYDARMSFVYEELRTKKLPFIEYIRSLESWSTVLEHALKRKRPVVYSVALARMGAWISFVTGAHVRRGREVSRLLSTNIADHDTYFKLLLATKYIRSVDADIWTIRITQWLIKSSGIKSMFVPAATERNFATVIACKLHKIPTIGILHGIATRDYNVYDFMSTYDGKTHIGLDYYGLWSDWWQTYYLKYGKIYTSEHLRVVGPMRPRTNMKNTTSDVQRSINGNHKVLFVAEQLADPYEVVPYLEKLLSQPDITLCMKFRPYRDGFELWLREHYPEIISKIKEANIFRSDVQTAVNACDIVVGSHSTAVLEALYVPKPFVFFATKKWGDCYDIGSYNSNHTFYAKDGDSLLASIRNAPHIPRETLQELCERFFGDPAKNGSAWVVSKLALPL